MSAPGKRFFELTKEDFEALYWEEGLSTREIGELYGYTGERVRQKLVQFGIARDRPAPPSAAWRALDRDALHRLYWTEEHSEREIARQFGVTHHAVEVRLDRLKIPRRERGYAIALGKWREKQRRGR